MTDTGSGTKRRNPTKTQISQPSAGKTLFTAEYKGEAVHHWKESGRSAARVAALEGRIRQLSEENAKLLEQREVLKKSLGILSEVPPRGMPGSSR